MRELEGLERIEDIDMGEGRTADEATSTACPSPRCERSSRSELSTAEPATVRSFIDAHGDTLSAEALRSATARLREAEEQR